MSIPPIPPSFGATPSPSDPLLVEMENRLASFKRLWQAWEDDPSQANLSALKSCLSGLQDFLENNKAALFQEAAGQGWSNNSWDTNFGSFWSTATTVIGQFLDNPNPNPSELYLLNEAMTQMNWLLTHFKS